MLPKIKFDATDCNTIFVSARTHTRKVRFPDLSITIPSFLFAHPPLTSVINNMNMLFIFPTFVDVDSVNPPR